MCGHKVVGVFSDNDFRTHLQLRLPVQVSVLDRIGDIVEELRAARREGRDMTALWASMRPHVRCLLLKQEVARLTHLCYRPCRLPGQPQPLGSAYRATVPTSAPVCSSFFPWQG